MGASSCMLLFPRAALAFVFLFLLCHQGRASVKGEAAPNHHSLGASELARSWHPCASGAHHGLNTSIDGHPKMTSALILLYQWNHQLFLTSLQSYVAGGLGPRIIIIDNSEDGRVVNDISIRCMVGQVMATKVQLTFSQLQNFMGQLALDLQLTFYFWGHTDVAVLPSNASSSFSEEVLRCMAKWMAQRPDWGVVFFGYDLVAAFRSDMLAQVKWDTYIAHYGSDCDFYSSAKSHGWHVADHNQICPEAAIKVYDLKRPLQIPYHNYHKALKMLQQEEHANIDHNQWKESGWDPRERVGRQAWEDASHKYFVEKWGDVGCQGIGGVDGDGVYHLHREPFQDLQSKSKEARRLLSSQPNQSPSR